MMMSEQQWIILMRMHLNIEHTGHPFHHLTAEGTIVDADPTLEYRIAHLSDTAPAVPVDRFHYGSSLPDLPEHQHVLGESSKEGSI